MNLWKKTLLKILDNSISIKSVDYLYSNPLRILTFHRIISKRDRSADLYIAHGVISEAEFERLIDHISRRFTVLPLDEAVKAMRENSPLPSRALCLTFDDGYRDVFEIAYPILKEHRMPFTVFLTVEFLDNKLIPWWDRLLYALATTDRDELQIEGKIIDLTTIPQKEKAYSFLVKLLRCKPWKIDGVMDLLKGDEPKKIMLRWDHLLEMLNSGLVTVGSHSLTHRSFSLLGEQDLKSEIEESKRELERRISMPVKLFCYPDGTTSKLVRALVHQAGYDAACTTHRGINIRGADLYSLRRLPISREPLERLSFRISGLWDLFHHMKTITTGSRRRFAGLKVFHITPSLRISGRGKVVLNLTDMNEVETGIICVLEGGELVEQALSRGIPVWIIGKKEGIDLKTMFLISKILVEENVRLVHSHNPDGLFYALIPGKLARAKVINTVHVILKRDKSMLNRLRDRITFAFTDDIITVSKAARSKMKESRGIPLRRIKVIYNGVMLTEAERNLAVTRNKTITLGIVSRLVPEKSIDLLIEALKDISDRTGPGLKLLVVGDGPERKNLERLSSKLGVQDMIHFLGYKGDVRSHLRDMDIFILPSSSEGLGISLLEAMSMGLPVVASKVGGIPEVVNDAGILIPPGNKEALEKAILKLISDIKLRESLGKRALKRVKTKFSLDEMLRNYISLYFDISESLASSG